MNPAIRTMAKANEEKQVFDQVLVTLEKNNTRTGNRIYLCLSLGNIVSIFLYRESSLVFHFFGSDIFHPEIHSYFLHG